MIGTITKKAFVAGVATLAGAGSLAFSAAGHADATTRATVSSGIGLTVRSAPTTHSTAVARLSTGQTVNLACAVQGPKADGSSTWYRLAGTAGGDSGRWVSASGIANAGKVAPCRGEFTAIGRTTAALTARTGPSTADAAVSSIPKGRSFVISCKVANQSVNGNRIWYRTTSGTWVSAAYVTNVGVAPQYCAEIVLE